MIHRSFVSVVLVVTFVSFRSFRWFRFGLSGFSIRTLLYYGFIEFNKGPKKVRIQSPYYRFSNISLGNLGSLRRICCN